MSFSVNKISLFLVFVLALSLPNLFVLAQTPTEERQALEQELKALEDKISSYENDLTKTQAQKNTLQNQVNSLKTKINKLDLQIKQNNLMVKDIGLQIKDTESSIDTTAEKIGETRTKLKIVLQATYEEDQKNAVEILLGEDKISSFFDNLVALNNLNTKTQLLLADVTELKTNLETQKNSLDQEQDELNNLLKIQTLQKKDLSVTKSSQETLLTQTKGKEAEYQKLLKESQARAQEIKSRIFELVGVSKAPTFEEAYRLAKFASDATGVRPALLLAILTQESNLGKNVGQCYLRDIDDGDGIRISTGALAKKTMHPTRDVPSFLIITEALGRDPLKTSISCPMSFGWGGAMGPAQFIPSTWIIYADQIKNITGKSSDPWSIKDAFLASALYLKKSGAASQKYNDEWRASLIYFAGSVNTKYRFYADSVMSIAKGYEDDIAAIENKLSSN